MLTLRHVSGFRIEDLEAALGLLPAAFKASDVRQQVVAHAKDVTDEGYVYARDPYGVAWPLPKDGHTPPMQRTKNLRRGYRFSQRGARGGWLLYGTNQTDYSGFLQKGTPRMRRRRHFPDEGNLPTAWANGFQVIYNNAFRDWMDLLK